MSALASPEAVWSELRFPAMGTEVHVAALGAAPGALVEVPFRVEALEQRWSRFRPDSDLCRLNRSEGRPVPVDDETFDLVAAAARAWRDTGHRFDPTVHDALIAAGYDRSFDQLLPRPGPRGAPPGVPGCGGIVLDAARAQVTLPPGTHLDLGGIGKGRTADLVATGLVEGGARAAYVNLGGDLRIAGDLGGTTVTVGIEDPQTLESSRWVAHLAGGALATSSVARRRWVLGDTEAHHLIDPVTGRPAAGGVLAVTVVAAEAMAAEVLAKAALIAGRGDAAAVLRDAGVAGLVVAEDGTEECIGGIEAFLG